MEFSGIIKKKDSEGKEKHVPTIAIDKGHKGGKNIVRVVVGHEVEHPNTEAHHIAWIELYGVKKGGWHGKYILDRFWRQFTGGTCNLDRHLRYSSF